MPSLLIPLNRSTHVEVDLQPVDDKLLLRLRILPVVHFAALHAHSPAGPLGAQHGDCLQARLHAVRPAALDLNSARVDVEPNIAVRRRLNALAIVDIRMSKRVPVRGLGDKETVRRRDGLLDRILGIGVRQNRSALADVHGDLAERRVNARVLARVRLLHVVRVEVAPGDGAPSGEPAAYGRNVRHEHGCDEQVGTEHELPVDAEQFGLVGELPEHRADRRRAKL